MNTRIDVQIAVDTEDRLAECDIRAWAAAALEVQSEPCELTIRVVAEDEATHLNETYRGKHGPTNVLSFPFESPPGVETDLIGDVVICMPVVACEARQQGKTLQAHCAHMVVHGALHLLGYDHVECDQAQQMESLECVVLERLGFSDPYKDTEQ